MALHHFNIRQHDAEPTPYFTLADERCGFTWTVRQYVDDGYAEPDPKEITFTVMLDTPDPTSDMLIGGTWNLANDGPVTLDSRAHGNGWWFQYHGHPAHLVGGTFRDVLNSVGFDLWRSDEPYDRMPYGFVALSVDHLRDSGGITRWSQRDNVNRALHAVPRDIAITEDGLDASYTTEWDYCRVIESAAERAYGCAGLMGDPDHDKTPHSYVEVVGQYMRVEWFRPTDPHEVYAYFRLPALARLFAGKKEARVSVFTFRPLQLDPTFAPAEITGCPDERDDAMEVANEARVHQTGPRAFVAVALCGAGAIEGFGYNEQTARNHVFRKVLHDLRDGDPEALID